MIVTDTQVFSPTLTATFSASAGRFARTQIPEAPGLQSLQALGQNVPLGSPGAAIYGAGKAGLEQLMYTLAHELRSEDITFNTIGISSVAETGMVAALSEDALRQTAQALPKPAPLETAELALAVDFFASKQASKITGQVLYFGGIR